ncbi:MAG: hypothetical protein JXR94_17665, partial [Candidatus Hydrogenedentes bacterium]|nr:hypothetical protein [Candidatus Hydrogenedentota bacterium]
YRGVSDLAAAGSSFMRSVPGAIGFYEGLFPSAAAGSSPQRFRIVNGGPVTFSGRGAIVPAADLRSDQVGIPDDMAWTLFGPVAAREAGAEAVEARTDKAVAALDRAMAAHWAIMNRAPSVAPTSLLAFHPVRVPGHAIWFPVLGCMLMNADFDGDQMAVLVPVTDAAQAEAGERLSIAGHLRRAPGLIGLLTPPMEALWGVAHLSLNEEGRKQIAAIAGSDLVGEDGIACKESVAAHAAARMERDGVDAALGMLEELTRLGFDAAKRSGASMCPFAPVELAPPPALDPDDVEGWFERLDQLGQDLIAQTDYAAHDFGPQLLALKSGARGRLSQLATCLIGAVIADLDRRLVYTPYGFARGLPKDVAFTRTVGALRGLSAIHTTGIDMLVERRAACAPTGHGVLARALASPNPGVVFARAALHGEVDPLTAVDARLLVGLRPL